MPRLCLLNPVPTLRVLLLLLCSLVLSLQGCGRPSPADSAAALLKSLIDPAKLATLGDRGANPRIQKITSILWEAKLQGHDPAVVAGNAVKLIGWEGTPKGELTAAAMVRNVVILERLGSTTEEDIHAMKRGKAPIVRRGPYVGEIVSVDHIIPRSVAPSLDNVIANLELMPLSVNQRKGNKVGDRQASLAKALHKAGLLTDVGLRGILAVHR